MAPGLFVAPLLAQSHCQTEPATDGSRAALVGIDQHQEIPLGGAQRVRALRDVPRIDDPDVEVGPGAIETQVKPQLRDGVAIKKFYIRILVEQTRFELATSCLQSTRSPN